MKIEGRIDAVTPISEFEGKHTLKFQVEKAWYNIAADESKLMEYQKEIVVGNKIKFSHENSNVRVPFETIRQLQRPAPVDNPYAKPGEAKEKNPNMIQLHGKDYMMYAGLLTKAHKKDPNFSMVIIESFVSEDMKSSWCKVRLTSGDASQQFDGIGSCTPENASMIKTHPMEMAHTRAKGRALRDFLDIGEVMAEKLKA